VLTYARLAQFRYAILYYLKIIDANVNVNVCTIVYNYFLL